MADAIADPVGQIGAYAVIRARFELRAEVRGTYQATSRQLVEWAHDRHVRRLK